MIERKSAREWDAELQTYIVDWDGFENRDPDFMVMTRDEFELLAAHSTRMIRSPDLPLPPEDKGTTEGAHESLFAWLNPIRQRIGVTQGPPEVSPAAREAAIQSTARLRGYFGVQPWLSEPENDPAFGLVQRAIDAAVAEQSQHFNSLLSAMSEEAQRCRNESAAQIARLTKELAEERAALEDEKIECAGLKDSNGQLESALSTERAAREKAETELRWSRESMMEEHKLRVRLEEVASDLRQKLAQVEQRGKDNLLGWNQANSLAAEVITERNSLRNERDILHRMLAEAELRIKENVELRLVLQGDVAAIRIERDSLAQRVAELEVLLPDAQAMSDHNAHEVGKRNADKERLKARCEKLEKALKKAAANFHGYGFNATAKATMEALNQSPE